MQKIADIFEDYKTQYNIESVQLNAKIDELKKKLENSEGKVYEEYQGQNVQ